MILQEGLPALLQCSNCGMHMHTAKLIRYKRTDRCNQAMYMRLRRQDLEIAEKLGETKFSFYYRGDDPLVEWVTQFLYSWKEDLTRGQLLSLSVPEHW